MRNWVRCSIAFAAACSSNTPPSNDAGAVRTVCEPPVYDAGPTSDQDASDAAADVTPDDAGDAGVKDATPLGCAKDTDCTDGGVCDTTSKACVADTGATLCGGALPSDGGGVPATCTVNASDICCSDGCVAHSSIPDGGVGGGACCPGPEGDKYCQSLLATSAATCGAGNLCTTCIDSCIDAHLAAHAKFANYQVSECGCIANGPCYDKCHTSTTMDPTSDCGACLAAQSGEGLASTCTLAAAADCSNDPDCTAYQQCAGKCPM